MTSHEHSVREPYESFSEAPRSIQGHTCTVTLLPTAAYDVHYTPHAPIVGFAFETQTGLHSFASDRTRPFRARPNSLAFTPTGCDVTSRSANGGEYLIVALASPNDWESLPTWQFNDHICAQAISAAYKLRAMILSQAKIEVLELEREIFTVSNSISAATKASIEPGAQRWMTPRRLDQVDEFIESWLSSDLSIEAIAAALGLSPGFFNRAFKAAVGKTPHDYILDRRVARARRLISQTRIDLAGIATSCGFASQAHMTTQFRQRLGVTPGKLRSRQ